MTIIKCKMCGGDLNIIQGISTAECEFCGSVQTVPLADDEKKLIQFERAERLRKQCEFDKAAGIYESIVADFRQEAEAYWGLVLCKYGIEYVDDPGGKKIPTCHRTSFDSIFEDSDFDQAMENADDTARKIYRNEAKVIEDIRKGIIAVSVNEDPYDIFICYKETDKKGERTLDSVLAQDMYEILTDKGYRVFFSRITLEDKLGQEYEPYIFAALNSAKVMLAVGTDYDHFNAVWVKNEWGRFLKMMAKDKNKHLVPCFKDCDAYDLPKEFNKLQAQDLGKVGAVQDLLRGIEKLLGTQKVTTPPVSSGGIVAETLVKAYEFLRLQDWVSAGYTLDTVRGYEPDNVSMLIGRLMLDCKIPKEELLGEYTERLDSNPNYQQAIQLADAATKTRLETYNKSIIYRLSMTLAQKNTIGAVKKALESLHQISDYMDVKEQTEKLQIMLKKLRRKKRLTVVASMAVVVAIAAVMGLIMLQKYYFTPKSIYADAITLLESGRLKEASDKIEELISYGNNQTALECRYLFALELIETGEYTAASTMFKDLSSYSDSNEQIKQCRYLYALSLIENGNNIAAYAELIALDGYSDSAEKAASIYDYYLFDKYIYEVKSLQTGDSFHFGLYEQDNKSSNGKEQIEWIILEQRDGKALVLSKYALDCKQYNASDADTTWETCTLRNWLNNEFMNTAFSDLEQAVISTETVSTDKNPKYSTYPGNKTHDQVFLLSVSEIIQYFNSNNELLCTPTAYAVAQGTLVINSSCSWWLRTPGYTQSNALSVSSSGSISTYGSKVHHDSSAIRPAMWIVLPE